MSDIVAMRPAGCGVSELIAGPGCWCGAEAGRCIAGQLLRCSIEEVRPMTLGMTLALMDRGSDLNQCPD